VLAGAAGGLLALLLLAPPAAAAEAAGDDPAGDVPFPRGDIVRWRVDHEAQHVDLRVRTQLGGHPVERWPNRATRVQWRISTAPAAGPEYFADIVIVRGVDTVLLGRVRRLSDDRVTCQAQEHVVDAHLVETSRNLYRFRFQRRCLGNPRPNAIRARATFIWDPGVAGVGPVHTDYAPDEGPTPPLLADPS
jgi:hypothetical protein